MPAVFAAWPAALSQHVSFHPSNSVAFFDEMRRGGINPALALVDGNHDYAIALADWDLCAALLTLPH